MRTVCRKQVFPISFDSERFKLLQCPGPWRPPAIYLTGRRHPLPVGQTEGQLEADGHTDKHEARLRQQPFGVESPPKKAGQGVVNRDLIKRYGQKMSKSNFASPGLLPDSNSLVQCALAGQILVKVLLYVLAVILPS